MNEIKLWHLVLTGLIALVGGFAWGFKWGYSEGARDNY